MVLVMMEKFFIPDVLSETLRLKQKQGKKIVFTNGCFDLLHIGHIHYLQSARDLGDLLVVAVNSDESVRSLNKDQGRPINPVNQRMEVLAALACVDYIVRFDESTPLHIIETLQPDILVKGGDWTIDRIVGKDSVEKQGGIVTSIPLIPGVSTSLIIERIQKMYKASGHT